MAAVGGVGRGGGCGGRLVASSARGVSSRRGARRKDGESIVLRASGAAQRVGVAEISAYDWDQATLSSHAGRSGT